MMTNKPIPSELFAPAERKDDADKVTRPTIGLRKDVLRRLLQNKLVTFGFSLIVVMLVMAFVGPQTSGYSYCQQELTHMSIEPNGQYWFGADTLGRDLFTRICFGIRYSLLIGILTAAMDFIIGVSYGGIAGMASSKVDIAMMRIAEIAYATLYMLIVILISVTMGKDQGASLCTLVLAMSITGWVPMAIMVYGQVLQLKENEYCLASRSLGASKNHILIKHTIPNTLGPILVNIALNVPRAIFAEAALSFMGLGLQPPQPSLGVLATDGLEVTGVGLFYQTLLPALFTSLVMFSFDVLGDGLQDILDLRLRKQNYHGRKQGKFRKHFRS